MHQENVSIFSATADDGHFHSVADLAFPIMARLVALNAAARERRLYLRRRGAEAGQSGRAKPLEELREQPIHAFFSEENRHAN